MVVFFKSVLELGSDEATYRAVPLFSEGQLKNSYDSYNAHNFSSPWAEPYPCHALMDSSKYCISIYFCQKQNLYCNTNSQCPLSFLSFISLSLGLLLKGVL